MAGVDDVVLYATEVRKDQRNAMKQQLKRVKDGAYIVIPTGYDTLLYVSEAEIGFSIDRSVVTTKMGEARTEWGNITSSKDWRPLKEAVSSSDGFQDCGIVTSDQDHIEQVARFLGLVTVETIWDLRWRANSADHLALLRAAGVMDDATYWSFLRVGHLEDRQTKPNPWGLAV
jgi:hypothetical protein